VWLGGTLGSEASGTGALPISLMFSSFLPPIAPPDHAVAILFASATGERTLN
jgi:hypothetical protein